MTTAQSPKGCSFLVQPVCSEHIFTVEAVSEDQQMFAAAASEFMEREVLPQADALEKMPEGKLANIIRKAGAAGLLMAEIPEAYGGLDLDKVSILLVVEQSGRYGAYGAAVGAHTTIGTLPIVFFGNDAQKQRYLPKLATGEMLAAYALTEPGSGSDALGAKTTARLSEDGKHWILNGQKIWITNAGFADLFTVFAKIDGEHFTAFLVERSTPGFSVGEEEHKMGLKGSSTRQLFLEDVKVPVENLLGQAGQGHKIAFNILNFGRFKLGAGAVGASRYTFETAVRYANDRHQFKRPISSFGAIQKKIAEMATLIFAGESMSYRVAGAMDAVMHGLNAADADTVLAAVEEFAAECSILKVFGSEMLHVIADEAVQIHGGMGYSAEYAVERTYRDNRVNRIFEGTNEINRLLIPGMVLKRAMKGELDLFPQVQAMEDALSSPPLTLDPLADDLARAKFLTQQAKNIILLIMNTAIQKYMMALRDQQQVLLSLADLITALFSLDSTTTRIHQLDAANKRADIHNLLLRAHVSQTFTQILRIAEDLAPTLAEGDALDELYKKISHFSVRPSVDLVKLKRSIAAFFIERGKYTL
jgi:alkylation response protein AidB-like acyl-CoA dehydrogenase